MEDSSSSESGKQGASRGFPKAQSLDLEEQMEASLRWKSAERETRTTGRI